METPDMDFVIMDRKTMISPDGQEVMFVNTDGPMWEVGQVVELDGKNWEVSEHYPNQNRYALINAKDDQVSEANPVNPLVETETCHTHGEYDAALPICPDCKSPLDMEIPNVGISETQKSDNRKRK